MASVGMFLMKAKFLRHGHLLLKRSLSTSNISKDSASGSGCATENVVAQSEGTMDDNLSPVVTEKLGKIFLIGINRPEKRNCVNSETRQLLVDAVRKFEADEKVNVAILHGLGGNFCAGMDLKELSEMDNADNLPSPPNATGPMGPTRMLASKPIIAAVSGYAVAGGLELALMCDLRIVEENAVMGVFCRRFGVPLIDGGTVRLPQLIGLSRALDLILTGRGVTAKEALEMGLANQVVECGAALGRAVSLARCIEKFPQACMNIDRASAYYATFNSNSMADALRFEHENGMQVITKESIGGAKKFVKGLGRHGKFGLLSADELKEQTTNVFTHSDKTVY